MSRDERNRAWPPSWYAPTSNDTRVRVLDLAKIMASVFPASGASRYAAFFIRSARSKRLRISSRVKSAIARKSRLAMAVGRCGLQNVAPQVLVLDDRAEPLAHARGVEDDVLGGVVRELEQELLEQRRHHGVEPARADVLHLLVRLCRDAGDLLDPVRGELELGPLRRAQRGVLPRERVLGLGEDAHEVLLGERLQLDADREPALQLGDQVRGLGDVERAGRDEQDVVGAHVAVAGLDG